MRAAASLGFFFLSVFIGAALLAPGLYHLLHWMSEHITALQGIANNPFHRYVNRSLLILGVAGLWPFLRQVRLSSWNDLGLARPAAHARIAAIGFLAGFGSLACVAVANLAFGARALDENRSFSAILEQLFGAAMTAVLVGFIEELFFRGALFGSLRKSFPWPLALLLSSMIYALLHFFRRPAAATHVTWTSGFETLGQMLRGFTDASELVPGFFNLTLAGLILGLAYQRLASLYFSIGLHAGWIFWLKFYGSVTKETSTAGAWFWGSRRLIDGWASSIVLLIVLFAVLKKKSLSAAQPARHSRP
jgi:uncharacterized protein